MELRKSHSDYSSEEEEEEEVEQELSVDDESDDVEESSGGADEDDDDSSDDDDDDDDSDEEEEGGDPEEEDKEADEDGGDAGGSDGESKSGWADAMAKVLKAGKSSDAKPLLLSRAKKDTAASASKGRRRSGQDREELRRTRKEIEEACRSVLALVSKLKISSQTRQDFESGQTFKEKSDPRFSKKYFLAPGGTQISSGRGVGSRQGEETVQGGHARGGAAVQRGQRQAEDPARAAGRGRKVRQEEGEGLQGGRQGGIPRRAGGKRRWSRRWRRSSEEEEAEGGDRQGAHGEGRAVAGRGELVEDSEGGFHDGCQDEGLGQGRVGQRVKFNLKTQKKKKI